MGELKFGIFLPFYAFQTQTQDQYYSQLKKIVLTCEELGYYSVWLDDHLMYNDAQILECWTTLSALAASTTRIRLGSMVISTIYRSPVLLAKAAATLDVISDGRLDFGIGTGVQKTEHEAYGFAFPKPRVRAEMLDESLEIITRLWTMNKVTYSGKYYSTREAICEPKPKQKPHPPIIVGGAGEKYTLKITAKHANRFDFGFMHSIKDYEHKFQVLKNHCVDIGRDFKEIERSCWPAGQILIAENQKELDEKIVKFKPAATSLENFRNYTLAGTPDECAKAIQAYANLGVTYFMLYFADLPNCNGLKLFGKVVNKMN